MNLIHLFRDKKKVASIDPTKEKPAPAPPPSLSPAELFIKNTSKVIEDWQSEILKKLSGLTNQNLIQWAVDGLYAKYSDRGPYKTEYNGATLLCKEDFLQIHKREKITGISGAETLHKAIKLQMKQMQNKMNAANESIKNSRLCQCLNLETKEKVTYETVVRQLIMYTKIGLNWSVIEKGKRDDYSYADCLKCEREHRYNLCYYFANLRGTKIHVAHGTNNYCKAQVCGIKLQCEEYVINFAPDKVSELLVQFAIMIKDSQEIQEKMARQEKVHDAYTMLFGANTEKTAT